MNFNNRVNFNSPSEKPSVVSFADFGKQVFAPFSEGFVLAGYERERHAKFAMMAGSAPVYQDAFEPCREPLSDWRKSQADKFPDLEIKNIQVNTTQHLMLNKVMESKCGQMVRNTKDSGTMIWPKTMEDSYWQMVMFTSDTGVRTKHTEMEIITTQKVQLIKVDG